MTDLIQIEVVDEVGRFRTIDLPALDVREDSEDGQRKAQGVIRAMVKAGEVEPAEARKAAGVPAVQFNAAVRMLKFMGCLAVTEAGTLIGW